MKRKTKDIRKYPDYLKSKGINHEIKWNIIIETYMEDSLNSLESAIHKIVYFGNDSPLVTDGLHLEEVYRKNMQELAIAATKVQVSVSERATLVCNVVDS